MTTAKQRALEAVRDLEFLTGERVTVDLSDDMIHAWFGDNVLTLDFDRAEGNDNTVRFRRAGESEPTDLGMHLCAVVGSSTDAEQAAVDEWAEVIEEIMYAISAYAYWTAAEGIAALLAPVAPTLVVSTEVDEDEEIEVAVSCPLCGSEDIEEVADCYDSRSLEKVAIEDGVLLLTFDGNANYSDSQTGEPTCRGCGTTLSWPDPMPELIYC